MTARRRPPDEKTESFAELLGEKPRDRDARERAARRKPPPRPPIPAQERSTPHRARFRRPDPNEPRLVAADGINDRLLARLSRGEPEPEEKIDLHGTRTDEARRLLTRRIESAIARGLRSVLVVHGRGSRSPTGEAALRDGVAVWLTEGPLSARVLALAPAPNRLGGEGATLVLLRKSAASDAAPG